MSAYLGDSFVVRTPRRCSVRKHSSAVILPPAFSENSEIVEYAPVTALEASKGQGTDAQGPEEEVNPGKTLEEEDSMEGEKATNSFKHMAPRPWKPFGPEKTEVMVVQQSKSATDREGAGQEEVGRVPVEMNKVEKELGAACKEAEEDEMDNAGLTNSGDSLNPFDSDSMISMDEIRIRKKSSKKKRAPQPPKRTSSLSESPLEGDEMKTENDVNDNEDQAIKKQDEQYNGQAEQDQNNQEEASQLEEKLTEVEIKGMVELAKETKEKDTEEENDVENKTTNTETVVTRTTRRIIDLTVRTSVIENIDEEDTLKELTEEAQHIPTDWNREMPDEKDYGMQTELELNVEKLAKAHEEDATNNALAKEVSKMKDKDNGKQQKRPVNLDIKQGWSDFIEGT